MFGDIVQPTHLLLILVVALIVLGPKRLPEVGRSLGRGLRDFRAGMQGVQDEARGVFSDTMDAPSLPGVDSAVSTVPEPVAPATAEPVVAAPAPTEPATTSMTKVIPVEPDPPEFAD
ncbi:MAG TPA: twin-arginine translocase TatA/TatE family subunit [Solirubrobacteraceae bacterium]|jgi:sec-independent protein translocase protein TatA|nr:twin-arginine translocase TatA/TatE family subunit [Solirubrobacteraceae bacterium]